MNRELIERTLAAMDKGYIPLHFAEYKAVMAALKAELEKPEPFKPDWACYRQGKDDALAEFSQEPVAWLSEDCFGKQILVWGKPEYDDQAVPLYTKGTTNAENR